MSTKPRSRRKPARSLVPYGNREEDGARAALPADLLDVLDLLFAVVCVRLPNRRPCVDPGGRS